MADFTRTVDLIFGAKDRASATIANLEKNLDGFEQNVHAVTEPLNTLANDALKVEAAVIAMGAAVLKFSLDEAEKFQSSFAEITTLFDASGDNVLQFRDDVQAYAQGSTQAIGDITGAIYSAISAGADYTVSLGALQDAEKLAVAGNGELDASLRVLVSSLNAYGAETDQATDFADALFTTVKLGQTTLPELAETLSRVTGTAAGVNIPFSELLATVAALTATGTPTAQAITNIKAALTNIIKPSEQAQQISEQLGLEFNAEALQAKGLYGVLEDVREATGGNVTQMGLLFKSSEALNSVIALTGVGFEKYTEIMRLMNERTDAVNAAFGKMENQLKLVSQNMKNNFVVVLQDIGLKVIEQFTDDVAAMSEVFKSLDFAIDAGAFDDIFNALNAFGADIEQTLLTLADVLPEALEGVDFSGLIASFGELGNEISEVFVSLLGDIDPSNAEDVAEAIQKAVNLLSNLQHVVRGIIDQLSPAFDLLGELASGAAGVSDEAAFAAGRVLGAGKIIENFGVIVGGTMIIIKESGGDLRNAFDVIVGSILFLFNSAQTSFDLLVLTVLPVAAVFLEAAAKITGAFGDNEISRGFKEQADALWETADGVRESIVKNANETRDALSQIGDGLSGASATVDNAANNINSSISNIGSSASTAESNINGLSRGIELAFDDSGNIISTAANGIDAFGVSAEEAFGKTADSATKASEPLAGVIKTVEGGVTTYKSADTEAKKWIKTIGEDGIPIYTAVGNATETAFKKAADSAEDATKKTAEFLTKMEQIASNERIKKFEATIELNIAKLEADAKVAVAVIGSIETAIESTGQVLQDLFGLLGESDIRTERMIKRQIELENKHRADAFALQKQYTEALIDNMTAKTDAIRSGDGLITIQGDGLEPELEAFMFKILERIQVKASEEQSLYLLGLPTAA